MFGLKTQKNDVGSLDPVILEKMKQQVMKAATTAKIAPVDARVLGFTKNGFLFGGDYPEHCGMPTVEFEVTYPVEKRTCERHGPNTYTADLIYVACQCPCCDFVETDNRRCPAEGE